MDKIGKILCASAPEDKFDRHTGQRTGLRLPWNGKIRKKRDCFRESAAAAGFCLPSGSTADRKIRYKYTEKQKNLFTIWKRCVNMYPVEVGA